MTDPDPEVERIAELAWRAYTQCTFVGAWPRGAVWENDWRRVARAVIADRAAQPPATDGPTLMEAIRERDDARRDAKRTAAECDRAVADARRERDAARTRAVAAEHERDSVRVTLADCVKALGHTRAERDEARELYTRAEQQRCDALTVAEANLRRAEIAEAERDVLQSRLDAMRREPTEADVRELREHITGSPLGWDDLSREAWIIVREALLTEQEPGRAASLPPPSRDNAVDASSEMAAPAPAPTSMLACLDCEKPYADFRLDTTLPDDQWRMIHDREGGLLCAGCMVQRAGELPGAIAARMRIEFSQEPPSNRVGGDQDAAIMSAVSVAPAPTYDPRYVNPHACRVCGRAGEAHEPWCRLGPAAPEPTLSPADTLDGAEEMLRRIAASACLDLDATEAAAIVAELDRLRAERAAMSARATVAETRHAAESEHLIAHGRSAERAAIVAWLRGETHDTWLADSIEYGDHLAAKEKP